MKNKKHSVDRTWDYLSKKEIDKFVEIHSKIWLKSELAKGGYWGVKAAQKLSIEAEKQKWKFFNNIYKTRPWFGGKNLLVEIYEGKVYAKDRPIDQVELSGSHR